MPARPEPGLAFRPRSRAAAHALGAAVTGAAFDRAGGTVAFSAGDGAVRLGRRAEGFATLATVPAHEGAVLRLVADLGPGAFLTGGDDGRVVRVGADGAASTLASFPGRWVDEMAVSAAGKVRAVAAGRRVRLLDADGAPAGETDEHPTTVAGLAFNPRGKRLAVAHYGGVTLWWCAGFGRSPTRVEFPGSHIGVSWSPDGKWLMTAMQERDLHGWRLGERSEGFRMGGYAAKVRSLDWSPRSDLLATSGSEGAIVWPFAGKGPMGRKPAVLAARAGVIATRVAWHPRLPVVAVGGADGSVAVADAHEDASVTLVEAGDGAVEALAWSPDGTYLAAGTEGGSAFVVDLDPPP